MTFNELAKSLITKPRQSNTLLIAIDGHGGSGKSFFAKQLANALKIAGTSVNIVPLDGFARKKSEDDYIALKDFPEIKTPFRIDAERLIKEVLEPIHSNQPTEYTEEDWWDKNKFTKHSLTIGGVIIVEGCYSLSPELRKYYDFSIFIDTPQDKSKQQAISRDIGLGADPKTNPLLWEEIYYPQEKIYSKN